MSEAIKLNIFQRLSKITEELGFVKKELNVKLPSGGYKAVGEVDVLEAVKPAEIKFGVYSYPFSREIIVDKETTTRNGNINQFIRIQTGYRFVNIDNPSEFIDITTFGDGLDSGDKAPGKAMTYGDKYALLKAYKISTGDDPDKDPSEEQKTTKITTKKKESVKPEEPITKSQPLATKNQIKMIQDLYHNDPAKLFALAEFLKVKNLDEITSVQAQDIIKRIKAKQEAAK